MTTEPRTPTQYLAAQAANTRPASRGQQLAAQAAEAAEVRDALTHPDVVALRVERLRTRVDRLIWAGMILGLGFTMTNVQQFTTHTLKAAPGSLGWWAAWLLDPTVSVILLGVLLAEREVCRWQIPVGPWARTAKWSLLAATYVMNTWGSYAAGSLAGIVLHSVPPLAVFMAAEAVTDCQDKLTEATHRAHTWATHRAEHKTRTEPTKPATTQPGTASPAAAPAPSPAPIALPAQPAVPAVPDPTPTHQTADRTADHPADRPGDQTAPADPTAPARVVRSGSATRTGPVRTRTATPKTDAQLSRAVRELAEQNGGAPPSQYAIKQRFGVGSGRAARLLAELDTTPAGTPASNGAAIASQGGTR